MMWCLVVTAPQRRAGHVMRSSLACLLPLPFCVVVCPFRLGELRNEWRGSGSGSGSACNKALVVE